MFRTIVFEYAFFLFLFVSGCIVLWVIVPLIVIRRSLNRVKTYNHFVDTTYTQEHKPTPVIILRIQRENIRRYNIVRNKPGFRSLFRKIEIPEYLHS